MMISQEAMAGRLTAAARAAGLLAPGEVVTVADVVRLEALMALEAELLEGQADRPN